MSFSDDLIAKIRYRFYTVEIITLNINQIHR